jgi:hypothetical protein
MGAGLWTDTQHMGYVLAPGETSVPAGIAAGLAASNRAQDAVLKHLKPGLSGNDVLRLVSLLVTDCTHSTRVEAETRMRKCRITHAQMPNHTCA